MTDIDILPQHYAEALTIVRDEQRCSTSLIQRRLSIGYRKAAAVVEALEYNGVVSAADHVGRRSILVTNLTAKADGLSPTIGALKAANDKLREQRGAPKMKPDPQFDAASDNAYRVTAEELRQFIEQYEHLEAEKKDITEQQKEVMADAKARGYDTKVIRKVIAIRKRDADDLAEEEAVLEMYKAALGMA